MENPQLSTGAGRREWARECPPSREELERRRDSMRNAYERAKNELDQAEAVLRGAGSREPWCDSLWYG